MGIIDYGGIITNIIVPDKDGNLADVVLGFDAYESKNALRVYIGLCLLSKLNSSAENPPL